ncbi:MAG: hypothetical protein K0R47_548 [Brevibacillus sp.]|nr:hypothetical protein [Brevibacillus sp.]
MHVYALSLLVNDTDVPPEEGGYHARNSSTAE